jgi:hypothetical protein
MVRHVLTVPTSLPSHADRWEGVHPHAPQQWTPQPSRRPRASGVAITALIFAVLAFVLVVINVAMTSYIAGTVYAVTHPFG